MEKKEIDKLKEAIFKYHKCDNKKLIRISIEIFDIIRDIDDKFLEKYPIIRTCMENKDTIYSLNCEKLLNPVLYTWYINSKEYYGLREYDPKNRTVYDFYHITGYRNSIHNQEQLKADLPELYEKINKLVKKYKRIKNKQREIGLVFGRYDTTLRKINKTELNKFSPFLFNLYKND